MSTIHTVAIILVNRILPVQTFLKNLHEILLPSWTSSPSYIIILHLSIVTSNYSCIMLMNVLIILIKIAMCYSQNNAGMLGSGLANTSL